MEFFVMVYAKSDVVREVKDTIRRCAECKAILDEMDATRQRSAAILRDSQKEREELNTSNIPPKEFRAKIRELNKKTEEALRPIKRETNALEKKLEELEARLLLQELPAYVADEVAEVRRLLDDLGLTNPEVKEVARFGRLGSSGVLNLRFETDKEHFKQVKKLFSQVAFNKVDVFVEG
ncbi:MAG: hypothetical protein QXJ75_01410 [Candidatus Bathyarchaeia archaeon]